MENLLLFSPGNLIRMLIGVKVWLISAVTGLWIIWDYVLSARKEFSETRRQQVRRDVRDIRGKIIIVTGSNSGIGKQTAKEMAIRGAKVIMACRDPGRAEEARHDILSQVPGAHLEFMRIDLGDLDSIRSFVKEFKTRYDHLDVLVNNAGIFSLQRSTTKDGFESHIGTNYLGPFLLTLLLIEPLSKSENGRIVSISSTTMAMSDLRLNNLMMEGQPPGLWTGYANSKLALAMFSKQLSKLLAPTRINTYALCTGFVVTNLLMNEDCSLFYRVLQQFVNRLMAFRMDEGMETVLHCILSKSLETESGKFYRFLEPWPVAEKVISRHSSQQLWDLSEKLVGLSGFAAQQAAQC